MALRIHQRRKQKLLWNTNAGCVWQWTSVPMCRWVLGWNQGNTVGCATENNSLLTWVQRRGRRRAEPLVWYVQSARSAFAKSAGKRGTINMHNFTLETMYLASYPTNVPGNQWSDLNDSTCKLDWHEIVYLFCSWNHIDWTTLGLVLNKILKMRTKCIPRHERVNLEEPSRLPSPPQINFSVHLSVPLECKAYRYLMLELKLGYTRGVICPSSIPFN